MFENHHLLATSFVNPQPVGSYDNSPGDATVIAPASYLEAPGPKLLKVHGVHGKKSYTFQ